MWKARQRQARGGEVIGRMYQISPRQPELYALRLLLLHFDGGDLIFKTKPGLDGDVWERLRWVSGVECESIQKAARITGIVSDTNEIQSILKELIDTQVSTAKMCEFFALLLIWHAVGDASELWSDNWESLAHSYLKTSGWVH